LKEQNDKEKGRKTILSETLIWIEDLFNFLTIFSVETFSWRKSLQRYDQELHKMWVPSLPWAFIEKK